MEQKPDVIVVGAGYVGLTLGLFIASRRVSVLLVDTDAGKVERLQRGDPTLYEKDLGDLLSKTLESGALRLGVQAPAHGARYWIIAVPYLPSELSENTAERYLECLKPIRGRDSLPPTVMIRSTVPAGFTRSRIVPRLREILGAEPDQGFFVSVCPERTLTGEAVRELGTLPQMVGGSPASLEETQAFFKRCGVSCIALESYEAAELGKAICNLSRFSQFNLVNFFGLCCEAFGINAPELLSALRTHYPRLQLPLPGPGVGGSCLPKDSLVLQDGLDALSLTGVWDYPKEQYRLNERVITHTAKAVVEFVRESVDRPILACGVAFKGTPRTDDTRNSVGMKIVETLRRNKVDVRVHDLEVRPSVLRSLGLEPAVLPIEPAAYGAILLLNNDPGYLDVLRGGLSPDNPGTVGLYDPWRLLLSDGSSVFARAVPLAQLCEQLEVRRRSTAEALGKTR